VRESEAHPAIRIWSASAGRVEYLPKVVNVFGQEFPAAFQQRDREEKRAARNKGADDPK
jgi:hypothetical protein